MFIYDLAIVEDHGTYYQVISLTKNTLNTLATDGERHVKLSGIAYKMIDEAIGAGNIVRLPKQLQTDEVLPGEVNVISGSIDPVEASRVGAMVRVRALVNPEITKISGIILYNFTILNNILASEGFFITNKNRETKYIEIIETGDADLIASLEQYLEARDQLDYASSMKTRLDAFATKINALPTAEEIKAAEDTFIAAFYAPV